MGGVKLSFCRNLVQFTAMERGRGRSLNTIWWKETRPKSVAIRPGRLSRGGRQEGGLATARIVKERRPHGDIVTWFDGFASFILIQVLDGWKRLSHRGTQIDADWGKQGE